MLLTNVSQCDTFIGEYRVEVVELEWDDENVGHITRHNVTPREVEDICYGLHISNKEGKQRYILSG